MREQLTVLATQQADTFDLVQERNRMENEIDTISTRNTEIMDRIIRQLESFYLEKSENGDIITNDLIAETMSEELEDLRYRLQSDTELSQLGLAVGIIHHEFIYDIIFCFGIQYVTIICIIGDIYIIRQTIIS